MVFCGDLMEMFGGNGGFASGLSNSAAMTWRQGITYSKSSGSASIDMVNERGPGSQ
jgi:hypothetical protein